MTDRDTRTVSVTRRTSTGHRLYHYDGVCGNVHGHNLEWDVELTIDMSDTGADNMPLDFKEVSDRIDETDHAVLLNENDPLTEHSGLLGEVLTFDSDPTTELVSQWMADRLVSDISAVLSAEVTVKETQKYGMTATATV